MLRQIQKTSNKSFLRLVQKYVEKYSHQRPRLYGEKLPRARGSPNQPSHLCQAFVSEKKIKKLLPWEDLCDKYNSHLFRLPKKKIELDLEELTRSPIIVTMKLPAEGSQTNPNTVTPGGSQIIVTL